MRKPTNFIRYNLPSNLILNRPSFKKSRLVLIKMVLWLSGLSEVLLILFTGVQFLLRPKMRNSVIG